MLKRIVAVITVFVMSTSNAFAGDNFEARPTADEGGWEVIIVATGNDTGTFYPTLEGAQHAATLLEREKKKRDKKADRKKKK